MAALLGASWVASRAITGVRVTKDAVIIAKGVPAPQHRVSHIISGTGRPVASRPSRVTAVASQRRISAVLSPSKDGPPHLHHMTPLRHIKFAKFLALNR